MRYRYVKAEPKVGSYTFSFRLLPLLSIGSGILLIAWVSWPILSFRIRFAHLYKSESSVISPLPGSFSPKNNNKQSGKQSLGVTTIDYTKASNWFPRVPQDDVSLSVDSYQLSISKLKIQDAFVTIGSDDLSKSLIHYGGTGIPGEYGNAVVFGHSVLPQFYNPKDYNSIFSTLPSLKAGDEIIVNYDGVTYTYEVEYMKVTDPEDVSGLEQKYDDSYLTLVTCVPPGTYLKRLWVTARLKKT